MRFFSAAIVISLSWTLFCCTPQGENLNRDLNADRNIPVPDDPISLTPGTVRVKAIVLDREEKEMIYLCTFRIEETHGYGSATPPLPSGSEVKLEVSKLLIERNQIQASKLLKKGNIVKATISFQESRPEIKEAVSWRVVKFHRTNNKRRGLK